MRHSKSELVTLVSLIQFLVGRSLELEAQFAITDGWTFAV